MSQLIIAMAFELTSYPFVLQNRVLLRIECEGYMEDGKKITAGCRCMYSCRYASCRSLCNTSCRLRLHKKCNLQYSSCNNNKGKTLARSDVNRRYFAGHCVID